MRQILVLVLTILFMAGGLSVCHAADDVITLEQAKELAGKNSRNLRMFEINREKAKYQLYEAEDQYDDAYYEYYCLVNKLERLQEKLNQEGLSQEEINEIQAEMESVWDEIGKQSSTLESLLDKKRDAESRYDDAVIDEENFKKQLDYAVEKLYTTILKEEHNSIVLDRERELKQSLLNVEQAKLGLGRSTRLKVVELSTEVLNLSKEIDRLDGSIKAHKGELNDLMGRDYDAVLTLVPFEVPETVEVPEYQTLLSRATQEYDRIYKLKRDIEQREDDLDEIGDDGYEDELLELEIEELRLGLKDEKYKLINTINNLLLNVETKQKDYRLALLNYENAKQNYEWDKQRFEMGKISKLDLMESELNYLRSENEKLSAAYDLYLAKRSLELAQEGIVDNL
ncbi:MAG: Putative outer efflux protein [Clostridia bacterium 62_21]|nr:MAG: Putative outer efflux protein [Clostridia bacterium 62_21]HAG07469.1 TolC family protein [Peptococcaceae bacterium]